jgi:transposase
LQELLNRRRQLERESSAAADRLAVAALKASEDEGASRSEIAKALGVGTSTVQGWVNRGRQIVGSGD